MPDPYRPTGEEIAHAAVVLGDVALAFGRVDRITYHPTGEAESDTDHTVMLGLVACAFAADYLPELHLGRIAQYALVHDLVEVYAGDTPTLRIDQDGRRAKEAREAAALDRLRDQFDGVFPWITATIEQYERRLLPEARYVKALDKLLPKITHILNEARTLAEQGMSRDALVVRYADQLTELQGYASDFPALFELRAHLIERCLTAYDARAAA